jgi:hypothetical protein
MPDKKELTAPQVRDAVRQLVARGKVWWQRHADDELEADGLTRLEATECLMKGYFIEPPVIPNRAGDIQYEFKMRYTIDQQRIDVVAVLKPNIQVVVITAMDPDRGR